MDVYTEFLNRYVYTPECKSWIDFTRTTGGRNLIDTGEFEYPNLLTNSTFEATNLITWSATGDQTGNWIPTNAAEADETGTVKNTVHAYKLTASAAGCFGAQNVGASGAYASTTLTLGVWTHSDAGNNGNTQIGLTDADGEDLSTGHKTAAFVWDTVSRATDASPGQLYVKLIPGDANLDVGIFDGVILVQTSSLTPTGWTAAGAGCVHSYDFESKIGTYSYRATSAAAVESEFHSNHISCSAGDYTMGVWAKCGTASKALAYIIGDNSGADASGYHSGGGAWEFLQVTHTANGSDTYVYGRLGAKSGTITAYFDSPVLISGSSLTPGWTDYNCDSAPTGDQYKIGSYSMRVVADGAWGGTYCTISDYSSYIGKNVTGGAWCFCPSTNDQTKARIVLYDGQGYGLGGFIAEDDAWHWETATITVDAAADQLVFKVQANDSAAADTDDIVYADGIHLYREAGIISGDGRGTPINIMGGRLTPEGLVLDGVDDYLWITNADMKAAGLDFTTEMFSIFVRGEFEATTHWQHLVCTRNANDKGYYFVISNLEAIYFRTKGGSDIDTYSADSQFTSTETITFSMSRDSKSAVSLYKGGNKLACTEGTHVDFTSSDQSFSIGDRTDTTIGTDCAKATLKSLLILSCPSGAAEQAEIARMLEEICP